MSVTDNQIAWEKEHEEAWRQRFGDPKVYAEKIKKDPRQTLGSLNRVLPECSGKSVLNVMGSNGNKAVALALLGAKVTVVDLSESNQNYALELAKASDVAIEYVVSDVLAYSAEASFDLTLAEMGILHYFLDLKPFFQMIYNALVPSGQCVLRDFHPVSTKLISSRGTTAKVRKHKVDGDYFDMNLTSKEVSYGKYLADDEKMTVQLRQWTLGEIITAAAHVGFIIETLIEEPNLSSDTYDKGIPKTFILKMRKSS